MKPICLVILLCCSFSLFSQQPTNVNTDYLKKSKKQKTAALVLLGGGATLVLTGIIIPKGELIHEGFLGTDYKNDGIKDGFKLGGVLAMLGSIPLFIASTKNKNKAAGMGLKMERFPALQKQGFAFHTYPALSFKIPIQ